VTTCTSIVPPRDHFYAVQLYSVLRFSCLAEWHQFTCSGLFGLCWTGLLMLMRSWPYGL